MNSRILLVEDEPGLVLTVSDLLMNEGYDVDSAMDGEAGLLKATSGEPFDLIILDVMMPGEDGLSLLKSVREKKQDTPVILLTARGLPAERIDGLKTGADDYLSKPFEPEELVLRIASILKRTTPETPVEQIKLSGMVFHVAKGELRKDGRLVRLTESEMQLLSILAQRAGAAISRHELAVLTAAGVERSVDVQVTRLRRKIERDPREPVHLQTVRGVGYRLTGE